MARKPTSAPFLPARGDLFEGKYRVEERIGQGGYASVFKATELETRRVIALKILTPSTDGKPYDERVIGRFSREARLISELHDPHTITLHDYGKSRDGLLFMVFEYIDGIPLDRLIKSDAPMPPTRVARILLQVLASLTEAHLVGVLHRDIKPSNLMVYDYLGDTDRVKVLDFGIAKPVVGAREVSTELTREGVIVGTPRYMSPEQVIGTELGPASDIFSVGLVAVEMLSGEKALVGADDQSILRGLLGPEPVNIPEEILIPAPMLAIIERMVTKDLDQRFGTTVEVIEAIHAWLSGRAIDGWLDPERSKQLERRHSAAIAEPSPQERRIRPMSVAVVVSVFMLGVLATAAVFRVTALEDRLAGLSIITPAPKADTTEGQGLSEYGESEWLVDTSRPEIRLRFSGADGVVETDLPSKVPVRSRELVEIVAADARPPDDHAFVCRLTGSKQARVRLIPTRHLEHARDAIPKSWELVTQLRGRSIAVADALSSASPPRATAKERFEIPLIKPTP